MRAETDFSGFAGFDGRRGADAHSVHIDAGCFITPIGVALIAATARGVCAIAICGAEPSAEELARRLTKLRAEHRFAEIVEAPERVQLYGDSLVAFLEARSPEFVPPLDILRGTSFQRDVWAAIRTIKPGETITYAQLARRIGKPTAIRAVAGACAANPLAIAIPCHRVIRSDGALAGYRWGVEWKRRLLSLEAGHCGTPLSSPARAGRVMVGDMAANCGIP